MKLRDIDRFCAWAATVLIIIYLVTGFVMVGSLPGDVSLATRIHGSLHPFLIAVIIVHVGIHFKRYL